MRIDRLKIRTYACALVFGSIVGQAGAQLIAYEGFDVTIPQDQTSVPLNGLSGTTSFGWQGNWVDGAFGSGSLIVSPGLQSPASPLAGIGNTAQTGGGTVNFYRFLDSGMLGTVQAGNDYFLSFLANRVGSASVNLDTYVVLGGQSFGVSLYDTDQLGLVINSSSPVSSAIPTSSAGNPFLVVTQIHINSINGSGIPNATMTVSTPDNLDAPSALTPRLTLTDTGFANITGAGRVEFDVSDTNWFIDEVRFGRTLSDVYNTTEPVPEPATLAVLALGAFGALRRRRQGS
jgi:hypothetical protein